MSALYQHIDSWNDELIFKYAVISLIILWLCVNTYIKQTTIITFTIVMFVIGYFNEKYMTAESSYITNKNNKQKMITPEITSNIKSRDDLTDFIFSIQDLYAYNPIQYEEMISNIEYFYDKFQLSFVDNKTSDINYGLMEEYKRNALNSLKSIIFSIPTDNIIRTKINNATDNLDKILTNDLNKISYLIDENIYKNGYNVNTKIIDYDIKSSNEYISNYDVY